MKKIILTIVVFITFIAFSNAQQAVNIHTATPFEGISNTTSTPLDVCGGETVNFSVSYNSYGPTTSNSFYYYWIAMDNGGNTIVSSGGSYIHTYNTTTNFSIQIPSSGGIGVLFKVYTEDQSHYDNVVWNNINVLSSPTDVSAGTYSNICGNSLTLSASTHDGATGTWSGENGVTFSNVNSPTATVSNLPVGTTNLTWSVTNSCGTASDQVAITRLSEISFATQPSSQIADIGGTVYFSANVTNANASTTYLWKKNGTSLSNNSNYWGVNTNQLQVMNITSQQAGNYVLYVNGECNNLTSLTATLNVNSTAINNIENSIFEIYPNPCSKESSLHVAVNENSEYQIIDITGKIILQDKINKNANTINISKLHEGIYLFRLQNNDNLITKKLIIK